MTDKARNTGFTISTPQKQWAKIVEMVKMRVKSKIYDLISKYTILKLSLNCSKRSFDFETLRSLGRKFTIIKLKVNDQTDSIRNYQRAISWISSTERIWLWISLRSYTLSFNKRSSRIVKIQKESNIYLKF